MKSGRTAVQPFKSTEIGELPTSWEVARIGDIFDSQQGKALSPLARRGVSPRPFLRTANVLWGRLDLSAIDQMDFIEEEVERLCLKPGDLLVCEGGEIGRTAVWSGEIEGCLYQNHIHRLRTKKADVDPCFVMYWMQAGFTQLGVYGGVGNRTTIPNLSGARLKQLPVPQPSFAEQRAIAGVLGKIQAAVEVQEKAVATLKELKAATMAKLFREGLRGEPLKQTEIGEIPHSWEVVRLGDYCRISSGGTPARDIPEYWNGDIPWVKTTEINYRPITRTEECISEAGLQNSSARLFPRGILLMAMYGQGVTRGKVAILEIAAATNQACAALVPDDRLDPGYLYAFCAYAYHRIRELGHGANQKNLSADIIREIRLPLPSLDEQKKIYGAVKTIDSKLQSAESRRDIIKSFFSSMLHLLMTGRVRVTRKMIALQALADRAARRPKWSGKVDEKILEEIVRRIVEAVAPEKIILFGSAARGEMGPDSDLDLLVVKACENRREVARTISESLRGIVVPKDVLVVTPDDIEEQKDIPGMTVRAALREGKVLYAA